MVQFAAGFRVFTPAIRCKSKDSLMESTGQLIGGCNRKCRMASLCRTICPLLKYGTDWYCWDSAI